MGDKREPGFLQTFGGEGGLFGGSFWREAGSQGVLTVLPIDGVFIISGGPRDVHLSMEMTRKDLTNLRAAIDDALKMPEKQVA